MSKSKQERLQKILEQIAKENLTISQAKEKLKTLNAQKKKIEKQIQAEEYEQLRSVLSDYGINTIKDFENFIDKTENPQLANFAQPTEE